MEEVALEGVLESGGTGSMDSELVVPLDDRFDNGIRENNPEITMGESFADNVIRAKGFHNKVIGVTRGKGQ